jgi:hypothetical protein
MDNTNSTAFRGGFICGMKAIDRDRVQPRAELERSHTADFTAGYLTAIDHFRGVGDSHGINLAHRLGLIDEYADFHGQGSFQHPNP